MQDSSSLTYHKGRELLDRMFIREALLRSNGSKTHGGATIGLPKRAFRYLLSRYPSYVKEVLAEIRLERIPEPVSYTRLKGPTLEQVLADLCSEGLIPRHKYNNIGEGAS